MPCRPRRMARSIILCSPSSGANMPAEPMAATLADTLVARHFKVEGGDLYAGGVSVRELAARYGTPLFIYDGGVMRASYRALASAVSGFAHIHYSVKANPAP